MRVGNRSLRLEIEDQMKLHGYNLNKVAELTGINAGIGCLDSTRLLELPYGSPHKISIFLVLRLR